MINREHEVGELRAALDAALCGSGRVVLVSGEPGIGKTRLASVIAAEAESRGVPVWWGRAWEDGSAPAFWPWDTAVRRWMDRSCGGLAAVTAAADRWAAELAHVFPALRDAIPGLPPSEGWESDRARFRLFDLVSRFLSAIAHPAGLVVVLDDLHWADGPSLKLLEFLAADLAETRILVVATYRDTEVERDTPLATTVSRLTREPSTRRLMVSGLSAEHCALWVELLGTRGDAAALSDALHRETNGNPFFIGELVHLLAAEAHAGAGLASRPVPHGVQEVIARRLDRLGEACRATLSVAALLGTAIDASILAEVLGSEFSAEHLERAVHDRILVRNDGRRPYYTFAHALIRRALVDGVPASVRASWHLRIATVLETRVTISDLVTTELVRHLAAAGTPETLRKAFEYACKGAEQAVHDLGWEEAVRLYEIALDVGGRSGLLDVKREIELELSLARALRGAGNVPAARERCAAAMTACRRTGNHDAFVRAALIAAGPIPDWDRVEPAVRAGLEEACRNATDLDDALKTRLYVRLAGDLIAANEVAQCARIDDLCAAAASAARSAGTPDAKAISFLGTYTAAVMELSPAASEESTESVQEAIDAFDESGEHEYAATIRYLHAMMLFARGDGEAFSREVDRLATAAAVSRVPEAIWLADALAALRATVQGRFAEGREAMERALATGRRAQLGNALGVYAGQFLTWHALQGRLAEISGELEFFTEASFMGAGWRPFRALARLAAGDSAAARAELQNLLADGTELTERGVMARSYLAGLAALCIALRDREHAPRLYERMLRREDAWCIGGGNTFGPWPLLLGGLARLCETPAEAARHFEEAIALGRRMKSPPIVARAQSQLASLLASQPSTPPDVRERAVALLTEARRSAQAIGLTDVRARVERIEARLAQAPRPALGNALRCEGDVWTVCFADRDLKLKDGKGPRYLAALLTSPGRDLHVLDLAGGTPATTRAVSAAEGLTIGAAEVALDDAPDARAAREYREQVDELRAEIDEAEQNSDTGRAEQLRTELDFLVTQLAQRFGGRARSRGLAETARKAVTKVLRTQIAKLLETHPALGAHLRDSVKLGTFCSYAPSATVAWDIATRP